eukprot:9492710-Pyramimonas_sp.AAC.1
MVVCSCGRGAGCRRVSSPSHFAATVWKGQAESWRPGVEATRSFHFRHSRHSRSLGGGVEANEAVHCSDSALDPDSTGVVLDIFAAPSEPRPVEHE